MEREGRCEGCRGWGVGVGWGVGGWGGVGGVGGGGSISNKSAELLGDNEETGLCRKDGFTCVCMCVLVYVCVCAHVHIGVL